VLAGVTRRILLDLAAQLGIPVVLEPVPLAEVAALDEAALSSSSRALVPIVQIEQTVIGNGRPGPVCRRLLAAYNQFVQSAVKTAVESEK
jgi:branched-subunit amino acid aminotransferase/4-amino-4-deoxychorismate lyase